MKKVSIIMGSQSDLDVVNEAIQLLREFKIPFEARILSAHRTPKELVRHVEAAPKRGVGVFIAAAGMSAALPGVIAAHTTLPVIGIPIESGSLKGLDALLSIAQMPPGIPVGCMSIGKSGAKNAAIFAVTIVAVSDRSLAKRLSDYRAKMRRKITQSKIKL
ncbi:MAG: 5-(carboxyamino)imidazole ribonucleotide mutase [Candidatus Omnitrophica bacterium]|nr:5-(carboxyamino)imidazole ribonucleotide mutase [Candidatus Omnitrophota bacterium]